IGDAEGGDARLVDERDAESLYTTLRKKVIPEFYDRDARGLPRAWLQRIRRSMSQLTPAFAGGRMLRDYVETAYLPLVDLFRKRCANRYAIAQDLTRWSEELRRRWSGLHIGQPT